MEQNELRIPEYFLQHLSSICVSPENASPIMDANKGKLETQRKSLVDRRTVEVEPCK